MRVRGYRLFELLAWPAVVWCALEVGIRTGTGTWEGLPATLLLGACAAGTITAGRMRQAAIAVSNRE